MAVVPMAPNDPVFFLHHCNIDRIWDSWQRRYFQNPTDPAQYAPQSGGPAGHNIDDVIPARALIREMETRENSG
jgi:tyrosinase